MGIACTDPDTELGECRDRRLKAEARGLADKLKAALILFEGHSANWEMADVIYRDLEEKS